MNMNDRLKKASIKTIGVFPETRDVFLEYKGKKIKRPFVQYCVEKCKSEFNIKI